MAGEDIYRRFLARVAVARKLPTERVDEIGQGRVWAGATSRRIGLVDRFGGLDKAVAEAARRAGLDPKKTRVIYVEKQPAFPFQLIKDVLMSGDLPVGEAHDPWSALVASSRRALMRAFADAQELARGPALPTRSWAYGLPAHP